MFLTPEPSVLAPLKAVFSPLLFSLYTNNSTSCHESVKLLKFADDTTLIGLISDRDESAYRWEIDHLVTWCIQHNLELNTVKNVEMVIDSAPPASIILCNSPVETVDSVRFLGTVINQDFKWKLNISSLIKKAQQRMYFLKKFNLPKTMMVYFYTSIIESILTSSITIWCAASTAKDKGRLKRIICSAEKVIGWNLPSLQDFSFHNFLTHSRLAEGCGPSKKVFFHPFCYQQFPGHIRVSYSRPWTLHFTVRNTPQAVISCTMFRNLLPHFTYSAQM